MVDEACKPAAGWALSSTAASSRTSRLPRSWTRTLNRDGPAARSPAGAKTATAKEPDVPANRRAWSSSSLELDRDRTNEKPTAINSNANETASSLLVVNRARKKRGTGAITSEKVGSASSKDL